METESDSAKQKLIEEIPDTEFQLYRRFVISYFPRLEIIGKAERIKPVKGEPLFLHKIMKEMEKPFSQYGVSRHEIYDFKKGAIVEIYESQVDRPDGRHDVIVTREQELNLQNEAY